MASHVEFPLACALPLFERKIDRSEYPPRTLALVGECLGRSVNSYNVDNLRQGGVFDRLFGAVQMHLPDDTTTPVAVAWPILDAVYDRETAEHWHDLNPKFGHRFSRLISLLTLREAVSLKDDLYAAGPVALQTLTCHGPVLTVEKTSLTADERALFEQPAAALAVAIPRPPQRGAHLKLVSSK